MFKRKSQPSQNRGGGMGGEEEPNEVQLLGKQLEDCNLPEET